jgi:hypothetical protein
VPLNFYRYDKPETFLNKTIAELPTGGVKPEKFLMSRDVASFPINCLLGDTIEYYDGNGVPAVMNPISTFGFPNFTNPITPPGNQHTRYQLRQTHRLSHRQLELPKFSNVSGPESC